MKNIIFMTSTTFFTKKEFRDLYADKLSQHFNIELWSVIKLYPELYEKHKEVYFPDKLESSVDIMTFEELDTRLRKIEGNPIIITSYFYPNENVEVYNIIKQNKGIIIDIDKDGLASHIRRKSEITSDDLPILKRLIKLLSTKRIVKRVYWNVKYRGLLNDYCLTPKKLTYSPAKKYIPIHHIKYDDYLNVKDEQKLLSSKYAVFLDSKLPYLSDILVHRGQESVDPNKYFMLLNNLFNYIEAKFNIEVVIAPHPKVEYDSSTFNGRKIIKYKTANLIHNSQFVLSHDSTSNVNAILSKKPLVLLYYDEMLRKGTREWAKATIEYSKLLGSPLINLEEDLNFDPIINENLYDKFINSFVINKEKKDKTNEEMIVEFINYLISKG